MNTGSILVYGGNAKERQQKIDDVISQLDENLLKKGHPDRVDISFADKKKSISINQIRSLIGFMSTKPYSSKYKIAVIKPAGKMTIQAQSALLKILEEPPFYAVIILSAKSEQSLLATLISRCRIIKPEAKEKNFFEGHENMTSFSTVLDYSVGERLKLAESLAKKEKVFVISLLEYWIREERYEMTHNQKFTKHKNIELLLSFLRDVEGTNVNTRLALENLFFKV